MREISLCDMKKNEETVITKVDIYKGIRQRLFDLGFVPGTKVKCVRISPFGDPKAFLIRGTVIALRNFDSAKILGVMD